MKQIMKRSVAWLLVLAMCVSFLPAMVFAADASDESSLQTALAGSDATITLTSDVALSSELTINRAVTIDGNGYTITASAGIPKLLTSTAELTLKNVTLDATNVEKYALNTYSADATLENVKIINCSNTWYGINVNGNTVTATNLTVDNCLYAGVNVDPKNGNTSFVLNSGNLANGIYVDDTGTAPGTKTASVTIAGGTVAGIATDGQVNAEATVSGGSVDSISDVKIVNVTGGSVKTITGATSTTLPTGYKVLADGTVTNAFTVKAVVDGAEEVLGYNAVHGSSVNLSTYPNVNWTNTAISGNTYTVNVDDANDDGVITLEGTTVPTHTVKFVVDGVTISEQTVAEGKMPSDPGIPAKDGYTAAWDKTIGAVGTADVTYTAVYTATTFELYAKTNGPTLSNVVFDFAGLTNDPKLTILDTTERQFAGQANVTRKFTLPDLTGKAPEGYTFAYWTDGTYKYEGGATITASGKTTYTAVFTQNQYVVKFVADGVLVDVQLVDSNETFTAPTVPAKAGYDAAWDKAIQNPATADATYTAVYTPKTSDITVTACLDGTPDPSIIGAQVQGNNKKTGDTVTFTVTSTAAYELQDVAVASGDDPVSVTLNRIDRVGEGYQYTYSFVMPGADTSIWVYFVSVEETSTVVFTDADTNAIYAVKVVKAGDKVIAPTVDKAGYTFDNKWYTDAACNTEFNFDTPITEPVMTLYGTFTAQKFNVTYDEDGGSAVTNHTDVDYGKTITLPVTTKDGYTFLYWETNDADKTRYYGGTAYTVTDDLNLKAVWEPIPAGQCVVKFYVDGTLYDWKSVAQGSTFTAAMFPKKPTKVGYDFISWADDSNFYGAGFTVPNENELILKAVFNPVSYTIKKDVTPSGNDGTVDVNTSAKYGEAVTVTINTPAGYYFDSITVTDQTGTAYPVNTVTKDSEFQFTMPAKMVTVTVNYKEVPAGSTLVKFYVDGDLYDTKIVTEGEQLAELPAPEPTKAGHTFKGWLYNNNPVATTTLALGTEMKITAEFEKNDYTVTFNLDGGALAAGIASPQTVAYGDSIDLPTPTKDGYVFLYWTDANNTRYYEGAKYTVTDNVTFTANWEEVKPNYVHVTFKAFGVVIDSQYVESGKTVTPPATDKDGYTFQGWKYGTTIYTGAFNADTTDMVLEAQYSPIRYTVTKAVTPNTLDSRVDVGSADFAYGSTVTVTITSPVDGYMFDSIAVTNDAGTTAYDVTAVSVGQKYQFTMPAENVKVTVNYKEIPKDSCLVNFFVDAVVVDSRLVKQGETIPAPAEPTVAHKTFEHWSYNDGTNDIIKAPGEDIIVPNGMTTLNVSAVLNKISYTVKFENGIAATNPADQTGYAGDTITLPAEPTNAGHTFIGWKDPNTGFVYDAGAKYVITGDVTLIAVWEIGECVVRFLDTENNTVVDYQVVTYGSNVTAPSAPTAYGKTFAYWSGNGETVLAGAQTGAITTNVDYVSDWTNNAYNVTTFGGNVTFTGVPTTSVEVGDTVNFTVAANDGYALTSVVLSYTHNGITVNEELGISGTYSFKMPDSDVTITAATKQTRFNVFTSTDGNANIQITDNYATAGSRVAFKVNAVENYVVQNVSVKTNTTDLRIPVTVEVVDGVKVYSFTMPEEDVTICADGVKGEFAVTYVDYDNTYLGTEIVKSGEYAVKAITPTRTGYTFNGWISLPAGTAFDRTATPVKSDLVLKAVYEGNAHIVEEGLVENVHSLAAWVTEGSSVDFIATPGTDLATKTGDLVRFKVAAKYNYEITDVAVVSTVTGSHTVVEPLLQKKWTQVVDGNELTFYEYAFTMPDENVKIDIYTEAKKFNVSVTEAPEVSGDYTINGYTTTNLDVAQGADVKIPVKAIDGWYVASYKATYKNDNGDTVIVKDTHNNDVQVTTTGQPATVDIEFKMVAKPVTVEITYAPIDYTVTCATVPNGTITADKTTAHVGDLVSVTLTPAPGYKPVTDTIRVWAGSKLIEVKYGGRDDATGAYYYQFTMPASDVTVEANFEENIYEVEAKRSYTGGTVYVGNTNTNVDQFKKDETASVTVIPDAGYRIALKSQTYTFMTGVSPEITVPYFQLRNRDTNEVVYDSWLAEAEKYAVDNIPTHTPGSIYTPLVDVTFDESTGVYSFKMPEYDLKVVVDFEKIDLTVGVLASVDTDGESKATITVYDNTINKSVTVTDANGSMISQVKDVLEVTMVPAKGYKYVNNSVVMVGGKSGTYYTPVYAYVNTMTGAYVARFVMPAENVTIGAQFVYDSYRVTGVQSANGEVTITADAANDSDKYYEDFLYKSDAYANIVADEGYYISKIGVYTDASGNNEAMYNGAKVYAGYSGTDQSVQNMTIDFKMPNYKVYVVAEFAPITYTDVADAGAHGTVTFNPVDGKFNMDATAKFTVTPDHGYVIDELYACYTVDGIEYPVDLTKGTSTKLDDVCGTVKTDYTFKQPAHDVTVHVTFKPITYSLTGSYDATKATINLDGTDTTSTTATYTNNVTVQVTPIAGYQIDALYYQYKDCAEATQTVSLKDQVDAVTGGSANFIMPCADVQVVATFKPIVYTDTVEATTNGSAAFEDDTVEMDATAKFTVTPDHGYAIDELYVYYMDGSTKKYVELTEGNSTQIDVGEDICDTVKTEYTFKQPAHDVTVHVTFKPITYSLTGSYNAAEGKVNLNGTDTVSTTATYTNNVTVQVIPESGYQVTSLFYQYKDCAGETQIVDLKSQITDPVKGGLAFFQMPHAATVVVATFGLIDYNVSYTHGDHGNIVDTSDNDLTAETKTYKDTVTFTVKPDLGYAIDTVTATYNDGVEDQTITFQSVVPSVYDANSGTVQAVYTFVMPDADVKIDATFKPMSYVDVVKIEQGNGESIMNGVKTTKISAETDTEVVIVPVPAVGFEVESVTAETDAHVDVSLTKNTDGSYTFKQPADEVTVTVKFVQSVYTVTYNVPANGTIKNKTESAKYQAEASFKVVPDEGYKVASVTATYVDENGKEQTITFKSVEDGVYKFTMPAANVKVNVVYTAETYSVKTSVTGKGSVQLNGNYTALENVLMDSTVTITATPDEGYRISSVSAKTSLGAVIAVTNTADGEYTFKQPADDVIVTAIFVKESVPITTASISYTGAHAKVTAPASAEFNSNVLVNVKPDEGYRATGLSVRYTATDGSVKYVPVSLVKGDEYYNVQYAFVMPACKPGTKVEVTAVTVEWSASRYDDVRSDDWYYTAVNFVSNRGYFKGIDEGIFAPNMNMNRAMFVTVLGRIAGINPDDYTSVPFSDVKIDSWYGPYVAWAAENGIVLGYDAVTFGPENNITREQMAAIMYRYCEYIGIDTTIKNDEWMNRYTDLDEISSYAYDYMRWAVGVGLMKGMTDTTINPKDLATRAQVAQVIKNYCDKVLYQ